MKTLIKGLKMFKNLRAEIERTGMTRAKFAKSANINPVTFSLKITGKSEFKLSEIARIIELFNNELSFEYLFAKDEEAYND